MDPYVYPGTNVLRNLRDIRDSEQLEVYEAIATVRRIRELEGGPVTGKLDTGHLQSIHHYIFQDVYEWAGEFRTVDISKSGNLFGLTQHIVPFLDKTFEHLRNERYLSGLDRERLLKRAAYYLGEINAVHAFREGNGRTQREFIRQLALRNGYTLSWSRITREQMIEASRRSFQRDNMGLERLLRDALHDESKIGPG
jgi:cell filamentation protein